MMAEKGADLVLRQRAALKYYSQHYDSLSQQPAQGVQAAAAFGEEQASAHGAMAP